METTLHFAQNADAGTEESYLRNLPLLKLLAKENIEADDWSVLLAATPNNEDKLLWCLGYTGTLCALDATDFDDWVVYCSTVVLSALLVWLSLPPVRLVCWLPAAFRFRSLPATSCAVFPAAAVWPRALHRAGGGGIGSRLR